MPAGPQTSRPSTLGSLLHSPQPGAQAQPSPGSTSQAAQAGPTGPAAAPPSPSQAHQLPLLPSPLQSPSGGQGPRPLSATLHSAAPPPVVTIKPSVPVQQPGTPFSSLASLAQAYQPHAPAQVCAVQRQQEGVRQNTGVGGCGIVPALGEAMGVLCSILGVIQDGGMRGLKLCEAPAGLSCRCAHSCYRNLEQQRRILGIETGHACQNPSLLRECS